MAVNNSESAMTHESQYIFRKPLWRRIIPPLLLVGVWAVPVTLLVMVTKAHEHGVEASMADAAVLYIVKKGVTVEKTAWIAGFLSIPLLAWLFSGFEKLIITPHAMVRRSIFGRRQALRWNEVDEVLIEHVEARLEGRSTARKILTLYAVKRKFVPWRRRLKVTNRQFEGYHHVERIASQVSIPAIAARKRMEIAARHKPARFAMRAPLDDILAVFLVIAGLALFATGGLDRIWTERLIAIRPYVIGLAALLEVIALKKFFYRQIGIDEKNLYVMRRDWITKTIPLDTIEDVRVLDNRLRIFARRGKAQKPSQVFRTKRFIRNRGVLLRLIREAHEARRMQDETPIVPVHEINNEPAMAESAPEAG